MNTIFVYTHVDINEQETFFFIKNGAYDFLDGFVYDRHIGSYKTKRMFEEIFFNDKDEVGTTKFNTNPLYQFPVDFLIDNPDSIVVTVGMNLNTNLHINRY